MQFSRTACSFRLKRSWRAEPCPGGHQQLPIYVGTVSRRKEFFPLPQPLLPIQQGGFTMRLFWNGS